MFEDGADQDGEVLSAPRAAEQPVRTAEAMMLSAIRTDIVPVGPTLTDKEFLTVPVVLEGGGQREHAVEPFQVVCRIALFHTAKIT